MGKKQTKPKVWKPIVVTAAHAAFGPPMGELDNFLPRRDEIPDQFWRGSTEWNKVFGRWFFTGLPIGTSFRPKPGINGEEAVAHIKAVMVSWAPKHERKDAGVAYLLSEWFESVTFPEAK